MDALQFLIWTIELSSMTQSWRCNHCIPLSDQSFQCPKSAHKIKRPYIRPVKITIEPSHASPYKSTSSDANIFTYVHTHNVAVNKSYDYSNCWSYRIKSTRESFDIRINITSDLINTTIRSIESK